MKSVCVCVYILYIYIYIYIYIIIIVIIIIIILQMVTSVSPFIYPGNINMIKQMSIKSYVYS